MKGYIAQKLSGESEFQPVLYMVSMDYFFFPCASPYFVEQ